MKKDDMSSPETRETELNAAELQLLQSSLADAEDRSQIPPPENKKQSKIVKLAKKNTAATVIISVFVTALVAVIVLLSVYLVTSITNGKNKRDYLFTFGEEEMRVKYEKIVIDDVLYVDMNKLAQYAELSVSGSDETMKYMVSDEQYVKFMNESEYAIINATKVVIPAPAIIKGGTCLVPYEVISKAVDTGIEFKSDRAKHTVSITRVTYAVEDILYNEDITFSAADFTAVGALQSTAGVSFEYNADVTQYLKYIAPEDNTPYLMLVNADNPLPTDFEPENLSTEPLPSKYTGQGEKYYLDECAAEALLAMVQAMYRDIPNNGAYVTSAYRSYEYQEDIFQKYIEEYVKKGYTPEEAEAEVLKTSARPGTSEHQSGLCVDFITVGMKNGLNNEEFERTAAFRWLSENAYKYGFILRYPKDKTHITSYSYESWHYRFVGRDAATAIYLSDICFEEYLEFI
ncbi:MAG: D-alanyl-D-alanine carboxypeptidase family protein [Clostridia bacterium]|nr:D-alanyl-D-alanine carboxypeptidase family protein [Clostridia bacterium]